MRAHGTRAKYSAEKCRCEACTGANRQYEAERQRRLVPPYIYAQDAIDHVAWLRSQGVGLRAVSAASGVSRSALQGLLNGPTRRIRPEVAERIFAVTPSNAADNALVDGGRTWAQIDVLRSTGIPDAQIGERIGQRRHLRLSRGRISARNARAIDRMYREYLSGQMTFERRSRSGVSVVRVPAPPAPDVTEQVERFNAASKRARYRGQETLPVFDDIDRVTLDLAESIERCLDEGWRSRAACRGKPSWLFFPGSGDSETVAAAKAICASCPVRGECLESAIGTGEEYGIWGGVPVKRRRSLAAERRREMREAS